MEAAVDLQRVPDQYLIAPSYDQVCPACGAHAARPSGCPNATHTRVVGAQELLRLEARREDLEQQILRLADEVADDLGLVLDRTIK